MGLLALAACSDESPPEPLRDVAYWTTPDGSQLFYDMEPAVAAGDESTVVVLLHGFTGEARSSMSEWAAVLEQAGLVVLNADWSPAGTGLPGPTVAGAVSTPAAVACAIDHAREHAASLGGDPNEVIVIGVSAGGFQATLTALAWDRLDRSGCSAPPGPPPRAVVSLAGAYDAARRGPLATALSGAPDVVAFVDPFEYLDEPVLTRFVVVHGSDDSIVPWAVAAEFVAGATDVGNEIELHEVEGGGHFEFGSPTTPEGEASLAIITSALTSG